MPSYNKHTCLCFNLPNTHTLYAATGVHGSQGSLFRHDSASGGNEERTKELSNIFRGRLSETISEGRTHCSREFKTAARCSELRPQENTAHAEMSIYSVMFLAACTVCTMYGYSNFIIKLCTIAFSGEKSSVGADALVETPNFTTTASYI